jgi:threonyl-tRNA synthetase
MQVKVLPVSEKTMDYAQAVTDAIEAAGIRVTLDDRDEKIGYKIREAQSVDRAPYMIIIGAKEAEENNVSVRDRDTAETEVMTLDEFIAKTKARIKERK